MRCYFCDKLDESCLELSLGNVFWSYDSKEILDGRLKYIDKRIEVPPDKNNSVLLSPGDFLLCQGAEVIKLSENHFGVISTKGSLAQIGIQIHLSSLHIDPGVNSKITFEIANIGNNKVRLFANQSAAKVYVFEVN